MHVNDFHQRITSGSCFISTPFFFTSISRPLWLLVVQVYVTDQIHATSIEGLLATSLTGYVYIYFVLAVLNFEL